MFLREDTLHGLSMAVLYTKDFPVLQREVDPKKLLQPRGCTLMECKHPVPPTAMYVN